MGILAADNNLWLMLGPDRRRRPRARCGSSRRVRAKERAGEEPLLSTALFRNRTSNLGLVTQNTQWLLLMGASFVVVGLPAGRARLRRDPDRRDLHRGHRSASARPSLAAERLAKRYAQRTLIMAGFVVTIVGVGVLLALVTGIAAAPGPSPPGCC